MNLHHDEHLFRDAVLATAQSLKIPEIYVEKDYWVTVALKAIFQSNMADQAVFKGGTALSKCYRLIERFSEDIDIVVLHAPGDKANHLKKKIRRITKVVSEVMPEVEIAGLTKKLGMIRKTAHAYPKLHAGIFGQVREQIILEATWLGNYEPYQHHVLSSFIAEMMRSAGNDDLIERFSLQPFNVQVLSVERTLCEKIMSLVRFSYQEDPIRDLSNKIRHVYDIHRMLGDDSIRTFFTSEDFDRMILKVGNEDFLSYKNNNGWLKAHPREAVIFSRPEATWKAISPVYRTAFRDLVFGELPEESRLVITLNKVSQRLASIIWKIEEKNHA